MTSELINSRRDVVTVWSDLGCPWATARCDRVQGSPQLFTAGGFDAHNPGASYSWTAPPPTGFPRLETYDAAWADELVAELVGN